MAARRIITVLGATGNQGYSIVKAFAKDSAFEIRAGTRDLNSAKAQALKQLGSNVTLCDANISDPISLKNAFSGSEFVFANTLGPDDKLSELELGKRAVDIAKEAKVDLFLWSSAPDSYKISGGKYKVALYDEKYKVEEYLRQSGQPYVALKLASFLENLIDFHHLSKNQDGSLNYKVPIFTGSQKSVIIWTRETLGRVVYYIATHYKEKLELVNRQIECGSEEITLNGLAEAISKRLGVPVTFSTIDEETLVKYSPETAATVLDMYKFWTEFPNTLRDESPIPTEVHPSLNEFIDTIIVPWYKTTTPSKGR